MVHGDDFAAVGLEENLAEARKTLEDKYKLKVETLGGKEVKVLNKVLRRLRMALRWRRTHAMWSSS